MTKVVIIGAGPSALFAAKEILENSLTISVEILEQGKAQSERFCVADRARCQQCSICATLQGVGGAGLFSDGKLILDLTSGGKADGISHLPVSERHSIEKYVKNTFVSFDGVSEVKDMPSNEVQDELRYSFHEKNLEFKLYSVLHMGTYNLQNITTNFIHYLVKHFKNRLKIETEIAVHTIDKDNLGYFMSTSKGIVRADVVIAAVGKSGAQWLNATLSSLGCTFISHDFFFGFRMETQVEKIMSLVKYSFDPKIFRVDSGRKVKVHCVCRNGEIRYSRYHDTLIVGGHSPYTNNNDYKDSSMHANLNILLSFNKNRFSSDYLLSKFREINKAAVIVQKLSDFVRNQTTKKLGKVIPSNLSMIQLGSIRSIIDSIDPEFSEIVIRFLYSLAELYPGIMDSDNLLYAPAIEWDMDTVAVDNHMETEQKGLFAIGDGAGLSQGIVYSAATGIIAAKEIVTRFEGKII